MTDKTDPWELVDKNGAAIEAIVVAVGYRLNIFGFLAGKGLSGNFGFWVSSRLSLCPRERD